MNLTNISKSTPIDPYVECDGWYCKCKRCWHEIDPHNNICPYCQQLQDWSWFHFKKERNDINGIYK